MHEIPDQVSAEDEAWSYQVPVDTFTDTGGDTLTYSATLGNGDALPTWLSFDAATRTFAGTPPQDFNGGVDLTVTATDGTTPSSDTFRLTIAPVNDAPVVAQAMADQSSPEDQAWSYQVPAGAFSDIDDDTLAYAATLGNGDPLPAWINFDPTSRTFSGTPPQDFAGPIELTVIASDGTLSASDTLTLTITPVDDAPAVAQAIADQSAPEDQPWSYQVAAGAFTDVDGDTLAYAATLGNGDPLPGWINFDPTTRTFSGTPPQDFNGALDLTVTASDGALSASDTFRLTITPVNDAPVAAAPIPDQASPEDQAWSYQVAAGTFTDVDNATLAYAATLGDGSALPSWLSFNITTRTFSGTPPLNFNGALDLKVAASDGTLSASDTFRLTITPVNDAPSLTPRHPVFASINEDAVANTVATVAAVLGTSAADVDGGPIGIAVTAASPGNGAWQFSPDGGAHWQGFGAVSAGSALLLRATDRVRFVPDGKNGTAATFSYQAWDQSSGTAGTTAAITTGATSAFSTGADSASITVSSLNDAPVLTPINPTFALISDSGTVVAKTVASLIGSSISDVDSGASTAGIAVTVTAGSGSWQYSRDNGGTWTAFGAVAESAARLLLASDMVRFVPNNQTGGPASFTYRGWDRTTGTAGGTANITATGGATAFSAARDIASISGNDTLTGTEGDDTLIGLSGDDTLIGLGGADLLDGGSGNDVLKGGLGNDTLLGGTGNDRIYGGSGDNGTDYASGTGVDSIDGGDGDDYLVANLDVSVNGEGTPPVDVNDVVQGGAGNDFITGAITGTFDGGAGNDTFYGVANTILGGEGNDLVRLTRTPTGRIVDGGAGFDTLELDDQGGSFSGVTNFERFRLVTSSSIVLSDVNAAADQTLIIDATFGGPQDHYSVDGSAETDGRFDMTGGRGADTLIGGARDDAIAGSEGDDTLRGNAGNDALDGGNGVDTAVYSGNRANYTITEDNVNGVLVVTDNVGTDGTDTLRLVNKLQFADQTIAVDPPGLTLSGNDQDNVLTGGEGKDTINGLGGNDTLDGGVGADLLDGGSGNDVLKGGLGNDTLLGGTGNDRIYGGSGDNGTDYASGTGVDSIDGGDGDDYLVANLDVSVNGEGTPPVDVNDVVQGGAGNDFITGAITGTFDGGAGNDTFYGVANTILGGEGNDLVRLTRTPTGRIVDGGAGFDTLELDDQGGSFSGVTNFERFRLVTSSSIVLSDVNAAAEISIIQAVLANTAVKLVGGASASDARVVATDMRTTPEFLMSMRSSKVSAEFATYVRGETPTAMRLEMPFFAVERAPKMTGAEHAKLLAMNRARYASSPDATTTITIRESQATTGCAVDVPFRERTYRVTVPPGCTDGKKLRLRDVLNPGSLLVVVRVIPDEKEDEVPPPPPPKQPADPDEHLSKPSKKWKKPPKA